MRVCAKGHKFDGLELVRGAQTRDEREWVGGEDGLVLVRASDVEDDVHVRKGNLGRHGGRYVCRCEIVLARLRAN